MGWAFIEDMQDEAKAFVAQLRDGECPVEVDVFGPADGRHLLLDGTISPAGVLMDIELSAVPGEQGTGAGLAQDIRAKQKAGQIAEFPIVRFSAIAKIRRYIEDDPGSDDLFDLKVQKEEVRRDLGRVQRSLHGVEGIYDKLSNELRAPDGALGRLLGLNEERLKQWSHSSFHDRLLSGLQVATHVAANVYIRGFLRPTGLLLDERLLGYRLGIDIEASGESWPKLLHGLDFKFQGVGADEFPRWWARGLEDWWFNSVACRSALAGVPIAERVNRIRQVTELPGLRALAMPDGSAGDKPWRACAISLERDPPEFVPIDPAESVRLTPRVDLPAWTDPLYAALGPALQSRDDLRLNRADLDRLKRKYGS